MKLEEILKLLSPIFSSIIIIYNQVNKYLTVEKSKNLPNKDDLDTILNNADDNFIQKFVIPDLQESYFYRRTRIATNNTSIPEYYELKNKLGRNFTWKSIKIMQPHLFHIK